MAGVEGIERKKNSVGGMKKRIAGAGHLHVVAMPGEALARGAHKEPERGCSVDSVSVRQPHLPRGCEPLDIGAADKERVTRHQYH